MVIAASLSTKYALLRQSRVSSSIVFIGLAISSFAGFYGRIYLENSTHGTTTSLAPPPPPDVMIVAATVSFSLSIFTVVYSLAAGRFSQVDYAAFQLWFLKVLMFLIRWKKISKPTCNWTIQS